MKSFWSAVGHVLAAVAKGSAYAAVWASQHPEAVQMVAALASSASK